MTKTYVVAVSGGVDSVVLLDMLVKQAEAKLVVAHFDHGMRTDSAADAVWVRDLAARYQLPCMIQRAELGEGASEEAARRARYAFLRQVAQQHSAQVVTAHHADDVLETIIINLLRGTGWRGLASLRSEVVKRPLLAMSKQEILGYAHQYGLRWREDSTNSDESYLRNYVRHRVLSRFTDSDRQKLWSLYAAQVNVRQQSIAEMRRLLQLYKTAEGYQRYLYIMSETSIAKELLQAMVGQETGQSLTRPQLGRALLAVKSYMPGTAYEAGQGVVLRFSRERIIVEAGQN